jgi:hypothetical protein
MSGGNGLVLPSYKSLSLAVFLCTGFGMFLLVSKDLPDFVIV